MRIITRGFFVLFLFFATGASSEITDAGQYLEKNVVQKRLSNGVQVVLLNRGFSPTLAFITSFRVGSTDESYRTMGAAHMLEHMLFKGTDRVGTRNYKKELPILEEINRIGRELDRLRQLNSESKRIPILKKKLKTLQKKHRKYVVSSPYDKIYTARGGVGFNASTSRDRTAYVIQLPANKMELWAKLESERLRKPVFREFYLERSTVFEERLMRYGSKGASNLFEKFMATAFLAHPYRHPTIGWASNITNYSIKDLSDFYYRYYIPLRMTITIVGKQDVKKTLRVIEKYFGSLKKRPNPPEVAVKEPPQKGERRVRVRFKSSPHLYVGWHKPTFPSRVDYVCDVISSLLSDGRTSRLHRSLVLEKKVAVRADAWNGSPGGRYDNLFMISVAPRHPLKAKDLEKEVYGEIEKLRNTLQQKELQKVFNRMESSMIFGLNSNMGIARLLSYYQTVYRDWRYSSRYLKEIRSVSIKEIRDVIDKYFVKENRTVGILDDIRKKGKVTK